MDAPRKLRLFPRESSLLSYHAPTCLLLGFLALLLAAFLALLLAACGRDGDPVSPGPQDGNGGDGQGRGFREILVDPANLAKPWGKALGDLDGDGGPDALVGLFGGGICWYRHPGWVKSRLGDRFGGDDLHAADIDGDGGRWRRVDLGTAEGGTGMAVADVNGDRRIDVVGNGYWLEQPASLEEGWPRHDFADWHATSAVAVADLNGDGRRDIVLSVGADLGHIAWFEAPADAANGDWTEHRVGRADYVHRIHLADMDLDGDRDIIFAEQDGGRETRVGWFSSREGGKAWDLVVIANSGAHNIAIDDVGHDGDLDILGADWRDDTRLKLWENQSRNPVTAEAKNVQVPGGNSPTDSGA